MKQVLMIAALAVAAFTAKAHNFHNDSNCDVEFRMVCIDPNTCTVTSVSSTWIQVPANSFVPIPAGGCTAPDEIGYEVQYDASTTGCVSPSVIVKHDPGTYSTTTCGMNNLTMQPCCSATGVTVHANTDNIHIQP